MGFPVATVDEAFAVAIQPAPFPFPPDHSKIVVAGLRSLLLSVDTALVRYNLDGSLDTTFSGGKVTTDFPHDQVERHGMAIAPDRKIVVVGGTTFTTRKFLFFDCTDHEFFTVARYTPFGALDITFAGDGRVTTGTGFAHAVAIQLDGKIVAVGEGGRDFVLARYNLNGSLDTSFGGGDGIVTTDFGLLESANAVGIQPDGKIVVAGTRDTVDILLARYDSAGNLDASFGGGDGWIHTDLGLDETGLAMAIQADGKIVVAGERFGVFVDDIALVRYNSNGTPDTSFGGGDAWLATDLGADEVANAVAIQRDGKIVVAGTRASGLFLAQDFVLVRYNIDGSPDISFGGGDGWLTTDFGRDESANAMTIQHDDKIVVAGVSMGIGVEDFAVARYKNTIDTTPPTVTVPANITAEATSGSGAVVTYSGQSASDLVDGVLPATCTPPSGSAFGLGSTTVTCTATDAAGNTGSASFTVTVQDTCKTPGSMYH